jgi:DNA-binding transcriptional regulator LsrR (DeoR family)
MRIGWSSILSTMARLNISVPDDLYEMTLALRGRVNLSEICASALRQQLTAIRDDRLALSLRGKFRVPTDVERRLAQTYDLAEALVLDEADEPADAPSMRESLGRLAAGYLDQRLCDGASLAVAGGRQTWSVVRHLTARNIMIKLDALGIGQADPRVLHAHANTLVTLLWLLYSPRSQASLVGSSLLRDAWNDRLPPRDHLAYFVLGSCSTFDADSPFGQLIGPEASRNLSGKPALSEFLYHFSDEQANLVAFSTSAPSSILPLDLLHDLVARPDCRVILVAGGKEKLPAIANTLRGRRCSVLITDYRTAERLLEQGA